MASENNDHTKRAYLSLSDAYAFFNKAIFADKLPNCLITLTRKKNCAGYFSSDRFSLETNRIDEIALNPLLFASRTNEQVISTLVHEMAHLWQQHFGKPSGSYHNKEWAGMMEGIGLMPSDTGVAGGKKTGPKMRHYIIADGLFDIECAKFLHGGEFVLYNDNGLDVKTAKKKAESKSKFTCPECECNAWGKPTLQLICGDCDSSMTMEG